MPEKTKSKLSKTDNTLKDRDLPEGLAKELARQQLKIYELQAKLNNAYGELERAQGLKGQLKGVYRSIDNKIMGAINPRGYRKKQQISKVNMPPISSNLSKLELLGIARDYDARSYFRYRSQKTNMKIHYRIAGKVYRVSRETAKKTARKSYKLLIGSKK